MSIDPRTPVIVGTGQVSWREDQGYTSPLELMVQAATAAAGDAGAGGRLLENVQTLAAVGCLSWPAPDPARAVAAELGLEPTETVRTALGGNGPVALLADLCVQIAAGELDTGLIVGAEAMASYMRATRAGEATSWPAQEDGVEPDRLIGVERSGSHAAEIAADLLVPIAYYPLFENAIRGRSGRDVEEHAVWIGGLWSRFAAVAADNPYAWTRSAPDAAAIVSPSVDNRMVASPYTKLLTANFQVDQGAALLVCSAQAAQAAGIARDRWVFVHSTAAASDHWFVAEREALDRSPAMAACGRAALGAAGLAIDDVAQLDLYSCFPSAVEVAARELGIDLDTDSRPPTVTGGLTFAGGPGNNYSTHALATMTERLRDQDGAGLVTALGWYLTKHAATVLSADPPAAPYAHCDEQPGVDALPTREVAEGVQGRAEIESYTAVHARDGTPATGIVSCLLADGRRAFAKAGDQPTLEALLAADPLGEAVTLDGEAGFAFAEG